VSLSVGVVGVGLVVPQFAVDGGEFVYEFLMFCFEFGL